MSDAHDNATRATAVEGAARAVAMAAHVADPLRDVLNLRRAVRIGVYTVITADLPLYYFVLGYTPTQTAAVGIIGWIIALVAVEAAFKQMIKLRKRSAYPNHLLVEMGNVSETAQAAQCGLEVVVGLLGVKAAAIGLRGKDGGLKLTSCVGFPWEQAEELLLRSADKADEAMSRLQTVSVNLSPGEHFHQAFGIVPRGLDHIVFAPVIALQNAIGVIVLAAEGRRGDVRDGQLVTGIGVALGLALENLRQRDDLQEGQERLERVVTGAPLVLFALDRDGAYTLLEGRGLEILGTRPEEFLGRSIFDVFSGRTEITGAAKRALAGEEVVATAEFNGAVFEARLTPLRDATGQLGGVIGVATDISERRLAEDALRASEERLSALVSNVPVVLFTIDRDGIFTLSEGKGLAALGLAPGEVVGANVRDLYADIPEIIANVERALNGEVVTGTVEVSGMSWETIYSPVRDASGNVVSVIGVAGDVTERIRTQEALTASEERYRALVENASDGIFVIGMDNRFISVNAAEAAILGYDPREMVGMDVNDVIVAEHRELAETMTLRKLENGGRTTYEIEALRKDGSRVSLEISSWLDYEDGAAVAIHGIARDVSERKRVEDALREGEERFRELFDNASDIVYTHDLAGRFTSINRAAERVTGYTREEAIGLSIATVVAPEHLEKAIEMTRKKVQGDGDQTTYELDIITKEGERVTLEVSTRLILEDGKPAGVQGIARDINERKRAEEALRESEELYRTLVETSPDAVLLTKANGEIVKANRPAAVLLGFQEAAELSGLNAIEFVEEVDRQRIVEDIQSGFRLGVIRNIEYVLRHSDGNHVPVEISLSAITDPEGEPKAFVAVARDVTERRKAEEALRESEEKYRELVENSSEIIYTLDASGAITYISPAVKQLGGYEPDEVIGKTSLSFVHPDDLPALTVSFQRTIGGNPEPSEYRLRAKSGDYLWVQTSSRPIYEGEKIVGLRGLIVDIDKRKRAEEALTTSEERYRNLVDTAQDVIFTIAPDATLASLNPAFEAVTGWKREDWLGKAFAPIVHPDDLVSAVELFKRVLAGETASYELRIRKPSGEYLVGEFTSTPLIEGGVQKGTFGIARDVTERKKAEAMIRKLAYHDGLTGLPNRALFEDRLGVALAQAHRGHQTLAVMFLDLDRFKIVNDTLGHGGGDKLLKGVAEDLKAIVREGDTVARVGGDEFTLLLPGIESQDNATEIAQRILDVLRGPRLIDGQEFSVTTSIGVTIYPQDGADTDTLLRNADTAMYRAKERGRDNCQLYTPSMNAGVRQRLTLEQDLRHALERGELRVYYQPIAETSTKRVIATEALVRWEHPERGIVYPDDFIPFAEETGMIVPIGEWVLREAMVQNRAWQEAGHHLRVGVNLSSRQLQQEDMVSKVSRLLRETGLSPELLQLEITEGAVMKNVELIIAMLHQIRRMGVGISLDDFGTGYSSLSYLKRFPIDSVKIDRSFVRDIATDPNDAAIVTTVIAMARSLNFRVIAEGVETGDQLEFLRERGCDQFQGYLISRPAPPDEIDQLFEPVRRRAKMTRLRPA